MSEIKLSPLVWPLLIVVVGIVALFAIGSWSDRSAAQILTACESAFSAEHEAAAAWRNTSDRQQAAINAQGKLIVAQRELLEEREKYIRALQQAIFEWASEAGGKQRM